ncbi:MAG: hypothetical protein E7170_03325 [Firmicutes bacterium]|nr:hypothetical protein [Bacillota bacterium]
MKFKKFLPLVILIIIPIILLLPLFISSYYIKHDTLFHFGNILAYNHNINLFGIFNVKILPLLGNDFGYISNLLYPPLSHFIITIIYNIFNFFEIEFSFKLYHYLVYFLSGLTMYELSINFSKSKKTALFSVLIYLTFPYQLSEIYIRDAIAERLLFIFLPMIISSILHLFNGNYKKFYIFFIIGYSFGIISHLTLLFFITILLIIFLLINYKSFLKKHILLSLIKASIIVILLTLFYTYPIILFKFQNTLRVFNSNIMSIEIYDYALYLHDFLPFSTKFSLIHSKIDFGFSMTCLLLLIITFNYRKKIKFPKYTKSLVILSLIIMFLMSKLFLWNLLPNSLKMIQFPWRLIVIFSILISLISSQCISIFKSKIFLSCIIIFSLIFSFYNIKSEYDVTINEIENIFEYKATMGAQGEYLPINTFNNHEYYENRNHNIISDSEINYNILLDETPNLYFEIYNLSNEAILELPRLYYLGYKLTYNDKKIDIYENSNGFIETKIKDNGIYELKYVGTNGMKIASYISLFTSIILLLYIIKTYLFTKKDSF